MTRIRAYIGERLYFTAAWFYRWHLNPLAWITDEIRLLIEKGLYT